MSENQEWESVEAKTWQPEKEGDFIEGIFISQEEGKGKYGKGIVYYIENKQGTFAVFSTTVLERLMKLTKVGQEIQIKFTGTEPSDKGQPTKLFQVNRRKKDGKG